MTATFIEEESLLTDGSLCLTLTQELAYWDVLVANDGLRKEVVRTFFPSGLGAGGPQRR